jgi:transcriptional regulator with XRE-family HTH domain
MKSKRKITSTDLAAAEALKRLWDAYRKKHPNSSQETVASSDALGMSQAAFSQYLRGTVAIGTNALLKFAAFFRVEPQSIRTDFKYGGTHEAAKNPQRYEALPNDALQIAEAYNRLPEARKHIVREYIYLEAIIAARMPWLIRGKPNGDTYEEWERAVLRDYRRAAEKEAAKRD